MASNNKAALAILVSLFHIVLVGVAQAQSVVATRTIRSQTILRASDISMITEDIPGTYIMPEEVIGMEARVVLYAGRPIRIDDIGPPAVIERNQIITLVYRVGGLTIAAEGRALGRAGIGDSLRVMNLASRSTVTGWVRENGSVSVGHPDLSLQ